MKKHKPLINYQRSAAAVISFLLPAVIILTPAFADSMRWMDSYELALKLAARENKPVMAFFYTTWCTWCSKLNTETYADSAVVAASREFVCLKIDGEKDREIVYGYRVGTYPAILFLDPSGRVIWREYGFREAPMLAARMKEVVSVFRTNAAIQPYLKSAFEEASGGAPEKAIAIIDGAIRIYHDDARLYASRGVIRMNKGDIDSALGDFDRSLSLNPNNDNVYIMRSAIHYKKRAFDKAMADCDKAISINKWAHEAYNVRGIIYMEMGEPDLAIKNFNTVIVIYPQHANAYFNRGLAYAYKGIFDKAAGDYTMALVINPELLNAYFSRAQAYFMMKDYDKSREDVNELERRGYRVDPDFLEKLNTASGR